MGVEVMAMKTMVDLFLEELEGELVPTRKVLERVPEGKNDWKPHPKSMPLGYLASLVGTMPNWIAMTILQDSLDLNPPGGQGQRPATPETNRELLQQFEDSANKAREALRGTTDDFLLNTKWKLLVGGNVVSEEPRYRVLRRSVINHWAHHRGQLTVYLRLNEAAVPAIYGPSADDRSFG
jgi:uncharacterized damage-inducible protein DinB